MTARQLSQVVIPLDGSDRGHAALRIGFGMAQRAGASVLVLHAADPNDGHVGADELSAAVERFTDVAPTEVAIVPGKPADVVLEAASDDDRLVCMASHGRRGLKRMVLGSVAEEIVRRATRPVVVLGPAAQSFPLLGERASMLYCSDGSDRSAHAVAGAARLAGCLGLDIVVTQSIPPDEDVANDLSRPPQPLRAAAQDNGARLVSSFRARDVEATFEMLYGDPVRSIEMRTATLPAAFVTIATSSRTGLERFTVGTTAAALLHSSSAALLLSGPTSQSTSHVVE